jgi:hypothetical protein
MARAEGCSENSEHAEPTACAAGSWVGIFRNQMIQRENLAKTSPGGSTVIQGRTEDIGVMPWGSGASDGSASGVTMSVTSASGRRSVSGLSLASCVSQAQGMGSCPVPPDCSVWQQPAASSTCPASALQQQSGIATRSERMAVKMSLKDFKGSLGVMNPLGSPNHRVKRYLVSQ